MIEQITAKPSQKRKLFAMLDVLWTNECYRLIRSLQGKAYIPTPSQSRFIRNRFRSFGQLPLVSRCTSAPSVVQINFYRGIKFVSSFFLFFFYLFIRSLLDFNIFVFLFVLDRWPRSIPVPYSFNIGITRSFLPLVPVNLLSTTSFGISVELELVIDIIRVCRSSFFFRSIILERFVSK